MALFLKTIHCYKIKAKAKEAKALNVSFIKDYLNNQEESNDIGREDNSFNCDVTASLLRKKVESRKVVDLAVSLLHKVSDSMRTEKKGNGSLYQSIGIVRLSECVTEDERSYLLNQNRLIINWTKAFENYHRTRQRLASEVGEEKLSQILSKKDISTFSNEMITEITNYIGTNSNANLNTKPIVVTKPKGIKPKHVRVQSTNVNQAIPNHIRIDLKSFTKVSSPLSTTNHVSRQAIPQNRRKTKDRRREILSSDNRLSPGLSQKKSTIKRRNEDGSQSTFANEGRGKEYLQQQSRVDFSPLYENKHIVYIDDIKAVLNEFKSKNSFLFA